jgi:hypothetical protein
MSSFSFFRTTVVRSPLFLTSNPVARRALNTTPYFYKSVTDSVKDTAAAIDRKVSDAAIKGIEVGEVVAGKAKRVVIRKIHKTPEVAGDMSGKVSKMSGGVKGMAAEYTGSAKGSANEVAGKMKGAAEEVKGKARGMA